MTTHRRIRARAWAGRAASFAASVVVLLGVAAWPAGCGSPKGPILELAQNAPAWPLPPDEPRVRYLGQISTDADLRAARGGFQRLGDVLFGKDDPRAMQGPVAVCTDGGDRVFIADNGARVVHVMNLDTRKYEVWKPGPGVPGFAQPVAVAWDPVWREGRGGRGGGGGAAGRLLVSDAELAVVVAFDAGGKYLGSVARPKILRPCGLAVDPTDGRVFVADIGAHQVVVLDGNGEEIARVGRRGARLGEFNFPTHLALDSKRRLYVSDSLNFRVQQFGPDLTPVRQIGRKGDMPGYFSQPKGVALDADDHLYVVDSNFEAVQLFDEQGRLLMTFGREGHGPGEFWLPGGMWIERAGRTAGRVWIADAFNRRVQVFQYLGNAAPAESNGGTSGHGTDGHQAESGATPGRSS